MRVRSLVGRAQELGERFRTTRAGRALARYGMARGGPLAGGIAYATLFSVVSGLALAYTAFMAVLGGDAGLRDAFLTGVGVALPGVLDLGEGGLVDPDTLLLSPGRGPAGIIAAVFVVFSALGAIGALRRSIQAMFGVVVPPVHPVLGKLQDIVAFLAIGTAVVVSSALSVGASAASDYVADWLGITGVGLASVIVASLVGALVFDAGTVMLGVRLLAGVRAPRRDLVSGALIAGVLLGAVRALSALGFRVIGTDPLLASFAAIVAVLVWFNLVARVMLVACAYIANPPAPPVRFQTDASHLKERPNYVTLSAPETLSWPHNPATGEVLVKALPAEATAERPERSPEPSPAPTAAGR